MADVTRVLVSLMRQSADCVRIRVRQALECIVCFSRMESGFSRARKNGKSKMSIRPSRLAILLIGTALASSQFASSQDVKTLHKSRMGKITSLEILPSTKEGGWTLSSWERRL